MQQEQQQLQQPQQQVIIIQQPATVVRGKALTQALVPSFPRGAAVSLGTVQILFGVISLFAASLAIVYLAYNYEIGAGYWCGMFYFISASVSMHAGRRPTRPRIKQLIAWSVISFVFAGVEFGLALDGLIINVNYPYFPSTYVCWWWYWWATLCFYDYPAMEAANGLMLSVSALELLICVALIYVSAHALKQAHPQTAADATVVEWQSVPRGGHGRRDHVTVAVVETTIQPQQPQQQPNMITGFAPPPPSYDLISPPAYVK